MGPQVFIDAYARAFELYERSKKVGEAGYFDAAAFYMRKILEVIADSFLAYYANTGSGWMFQQYCASKYRNSPSLDDKIDFLLEQKSIPQSSRSTYDAVRRYGNAAIHKPDYRENPKQHDAMMQALAVELIAFHQMAMQ